jgi:hypothetical protein
VEQNYEIFSPAMAWSFRVAETNAVAHAGFGCLADLRRLRPMMRLYSGKKSFATVGA